MFNLTTDSLFQQTLLPFSELNYFNDPIVHQAEIPAANGITNARSIARIYASLEYGQSGKENTTVADIMPHRAGLPALRNSNMSIREYLDWYSVIYKLEKQEPYWVPGTQHGYHAYTYGWLAGELVRRVDIKKRTLGQFITDEIAKPTQSEFYIGLPGDYESRVSPIVTKALEKQMFNLTTDSLFQQTLLPFSELNYFNDPI
ncbi:unnamed protein product, partial [Rotaria sp. Silwood2]